MDQLADDARRYGPVFHDVVLYAGFAAVNMVDVEPWLAQKFPMHTIPWLTPVIADVAAVEISDPSFRDDPFDHVKCVVRLPVAWFQGPVRGLLYLKVLQALMDSVDALGARFGLGPAPVKGGGRHRHLIELWDPFTEDGEGDRYDDVAAWARSTVDTLDAGQILVLAHAPEERSEDRALRRIVECLGAPIQVETRAAENGRNIRAWRVQQPPPPGRSRTHGRTGRRSTPR